MRNSFAHHVERAVQAKTEGDAHKVQTEKHCAFLSRRHLLSETVAGSSDSIGLLYPMLSVDKIEKIITGVGCATITQLMNRVDDFEEDDTDVVDAVMRWRTVRRRAWRKAVMPCVSLLRRAVGSVGMNLAVAGEFARHKDTLISLDFVLESDSDNETAKALEQIEGVAGAPVTKVSPTEARFVMRTTAGLRITCAVHLASRKDFCASLIFHTGPKSFIDKVNAKMARVGLKLTPTGLVGPSDEHIACTTEDKVWETLSSPTPPASARDIIDDVLCDTSSIVRYNSKTVDTGIMFRDGGILDSMVANLRTGLADVTHGGLVVPAQVCKQVTKRELDKAHQVQNTIGVKMSTGLLITSNTLACLDLAEFVDYIVVEDDETHNLYTKAIPAALATQKKVVVRNPLMFIGGVCLLDETMSKSDVLSKLDRMKVCVEVSGSDCYAGAPIEATVDLAATSCKMTIGSACDPWSMTTGLYAARVKCCQAVVKQRRIMSAKQFQKWTAN